MEERFRDQVPPTSHSRKKLIFTTHVTGASKIYEKDPIFM